jgi:hypothetical protein
MVESWVNLPMVLILIDEVAAAGESDSASRRDFLPSLSNTPSSGLDINMSNARRGVVTRAGHARAAGQVRREVGGGRRICRLCEIARRIFS